MQVICTQTTNYKVNYMYMVKDNKANYKNYSGICPAHKQSVRYQRTSGRRILEEMTQDEKSESDFCENRPIVVTIELIDLW